MNTLVRLLIAYTALLCRALGITPGQINKVRVRNRAGFSPRPEGSLGFYYTSLH